MTLQVRELDYCKLDVHYSAPKEKVIEKRTEALNQLKKEKVNIPGFRKGKAPDNVLKTHFKAPIENWVSEQLLQEAYSDLLFEHKIKPIYQPQVISNQLKDDEFWCDLVVMKKPSFNLEDMVFDIPKPVIPDLNEQVNQSLQSIREQYGNMEPYSDNMTVQNKDKVTLDFKKMKGEEVVDSQEGILHLVGSNPEWAEHLFGMKAGETKTVMIDDYALIFSVNMGLRITPAALDDDLAKKLNFETFDLLKQAVDKAVKNQLDTQHQDAVNQQFIAKVIEKYTFKCPDWLVLLDAQRQASMQGNKWENLPEEIKNLWLEKSNKSVKLSFILDTVREENPEAVFSEEEIITGLKKKVAMNGQDPEEFIKTSKENGSLIGIIAGLKDQLTLEFLVSKCNIIE